MKSYSLTLISLLALASCRSDSGPTSAVPESWGDNVSTERIVGKVSAKSGLIHPEFWPKQNPVMVREAEREAKIMELLAQMTLEEKVGQVIQADIASVTPDEVRDYNLGSVLNGGGSAPGGDNRATADLWLALADEFWVAPSMAKIRATTCLRKPSCEISKRRLIRQPSTRACSR